MTDLSDSTENKLGTILVVDDEEPVREATEIMLELAGYSVLSASGGIETIEIFNPAQQEINEVS